MIASIWRRRRRRLRGGFLFITTRGAMSAAYAAAATGGCYRHTQYDIICDDAAHYHGRFTGRISAQCYIDGFHADFVGRCCAESSDAAAR